MNLEQWKASTLKNYQKRHDPPYHEVDHIVDYLSHHPSLRLTRLSYPQAKVKAEAWTLALNRKNKGQKNHGKEKVLLTFPNGLRIVDLRDQAALSWEGIHMKHCVASYRISGVNKIYSLRDINNIPHCTMEISSKKALQVKGNSNQLIQHRYAPYVLDFFKKFNISPYASRDCAWLDNLGYKPISSKMRYLINYLFKGADFLKLGKHHFIKSSSILIPQNKRLRTPWVFIFSSKMNEETFINLFKAISDTNSPQAFLYLLKNYEPDQAHAVTFKLISNWGNFNPEKVYNKLDDDLLKFILEHAGMYFINKLIYQCFKNNNKQCFDKIRNHLGYIVYKNENLATLMNPQQEEWFKECVIHCPDRKIISELIKDAVRFNNLPLAKFIIENAPMSSFEDLSTLSCAVSSLEMMQYLLGTPFKAGIKHPLFLERLISNKIFGEEPQAKINRVQLAVNEGANKATLLNYTLTAADYDLSQWLIKSGAMVDFSLDPLLLKAITDKNYLMSKLLLELGANPHFRNYDGLVYASKHSKEIKDLLLNYIKRNPIPESEPSETDPLNKSLTGLKGWLGSV